MAYGLKCWTAAGYVAFDSDQMVSYVKVVVSGTVSLAANATSSSISAPGYNYVYVFGPTSAYFLASAFTLTKYSTYFTIKNNTPISTTFGYMAFRLN